MSCLLCCILEHFSDLHYLKAAHSSPEQKHLPCNLLIFEFSNSKGPSIQGCLNGNMVQPIVQQWIEKFRNGSHKQQGKNRESVHLLNKVRSMCATATAEVTSTEDTQTCRQPSPSEKESRATTQSPRHNFQGCSSCYAHLYILLQKAFPYHRCHSSLPAMQQSPATFRQGTQQIPKHHKITSTPTYLDSNCFHIK